MHFLQAATGRRVRVIRAPWELGEVSIVHIAKPYALLASAVQGFPFCLCLRSAERPNYIRDTGALRRRYGTAISSIDVATVDFFKGD